MGSHENWLQATVGTLPVINKAIRVHFGEFQVSVTVFVIRP